MGEAMQPGAARRTRAEIVALILVLLGLAAVMVPVLTRTYQTSLTLRCRQQLSVLFTAVQSYALGCDGRLPGRDWQERIGSLLEAQDAAAGRSARVWRCPVGGGYVGNGKVFGHASRGLAAFQLKLEVGLIADGTARCGGGGLGDADCIDWRHRGGANVVFLDGHVEWAPQAKGERVRRHWNHPQ